LQNSGIPKNHQHIHQLSKAQTAFFCNEKKKKEKKRGSFLFLFNPQKGLPSLTTAISVDCCKNKSWLAHWRFQDGAEARFMFTVVALPVEKKGKGLPPFFLRKTSGRNCNPESLLPKQ
jgi:hypothetical protein